LEAFAFGSRLPRGRQIADGPAGSFENVLSPPPIATSVKRRCAPRQTKSENELFMVLRRPTHYKTINQTHAKTQRGNLSDIRKA